MNSEDRIFCPLPGLAYCVREPGNFRDEAR
jgi:hypothetical protein